MSKFKAWLGQVTTGHGIMVLLPTVLAVASGQMTWPVAVPLLVGGALGLIWPENTKLQQAGQTVASELTTIASNGVIRAIALTMAIGMLLVLSACGGAGMQTGINNALTSPPGQLFCAIQKAGGGTLIVGLINAEVTGAAPAAAPIAILATGASKAFVDNTCDQAGKNVGGVGVPVSPPANPSAVPQVAVVAPPANLAPATSPTVPGAT